MGFLRKLSGESGAKRAARDQIAAGREAGFALQAGVSRAQDILEPATTGFAPSLARLRSEIEGQRPRSEILQPLVDFDATNPLNPLAASLLTAAQTPGDTRAAEELRGVTTPIYDIEAARNDPNFIAENRAAIEQSRAFAASGGKSLSGGQLLEEINIARGGLRRFAQDKFSRDLQSARFEVDKLARESGITRADEQQAFWKLIEGVNTQQNITESDFNRLLRTIATESGLTTDRLNQLLAEVAIGQRAAFTAAGLESGLGAQLSDIELQKGNVKAAARAAEGAGGRLLLDTALKIGAIAAGAGAFQGLGGKIGGLFGKIGSGVSSAKPALFAG
jgi:hypothetical protein